MLHIRSYFLSALLLLPVLLTAQPVKRPIQPSDIVKIKSVSNGKISPDGKWFLYTLTTTDSAKDKRNTDIWMMSWDGTENIQITNSPDGESNPQWSPDGKYISFVASRNDGTSQVYLLNRMGGEAIKLTDVKGDLGEYAWSPDAKKLALTITDPEDTSAKKNPKPYVITRYRFKVDVTGYQYDERKTHIYLFDVAAKKTDTLTSGKFDEGGIQWSPDGSRISFVSNRTEDPDKNSNSDIYIIDAKPGAVARQLTTWPGSDYGPQWSPDSKQIAYARSAAPDNYIMYDHPTLAVIPATGGEPMLLGKNLDRGITNHRWHNDGKKLMAIVTDDCERYIVSFETATGKMEKIIGGNRNFNSVIPHPNGSWLTGMADAYLSYEWYALENGTLRRLTKVHDEFFSGLSLGRVEKIVSRSKDGATVSSLLFLPPGSDGKNLPAIFYIHGGPVAQDDYGFDITRHILAAQGYAVIGVNYRGSSGRGLAFCKSIYADWGNKEVLDIIGAADHLIKNGTIDASRMGIGGWSYGGILTNYTIATDSRFKAAVSGAGSALQLSLYGVDQYILQLDNELGQPWKNKNYEKYLKMSYPFLQADKIKTPTLFMVGEKDFNVPAIGSEQMYQALRSMGTPTELVIYPGQFHGITLPSFQKDRLERHISWFNKYIKGK